MNVPMGTNFKTRAHSTKSVTMGKRFLDSLKAQETHLKFRLGA